MKDVIALVGFARKDNISKAAVQFIISLKSLYGRKEKIMKRVNFFALILMAAIAMSACAAETSQSNSAVDDVFTPTPQALDSTPAQTGGNDTLEVFSSDELGLCFSYPEGFDQNSSGDTFSIDTPHIPGAGDTHFWLEISDSYDRTALRIADETLTIEASMGIPRSSIGWWSITLDGVEAVVLDGISGQDLQRRVYAVRDQTLYILAFMPTRSEDQAASDQMETLYTAVTNSWSWSPCSASE